MIQEEVRVWLSVLRILEKKAHKEKSYLTQNPMPREIYKAQNKIRKNTLQNFTVLSWFLNRFVIEVFGGVFVWSCCFVDFSVGIGAFIIGLSQISSFFFLNSGYGRTVDDQLDLQLLNSTRTCVVDLVYGLNRPSLLKSVISKVHTLKKWNNPPHRPRGHFKKNI